MGGPCLIESDASGTLISGKHYKRAPACTDNFQVVRRGDDPGFVFDGTAYFSCEQAFQAAKFDKQSPSRHAIDTMCPFSGETDEEFGNRCWSLGQGEADKRADWDTFKVKVMLAVNRAKYNEHPELQRDLLSTLPETLHGNPFTTSWTSRGKKHSWALWNGMVQQLIREELRPPEQQNNELMCSIIREIGMYSYSRANFAPKDQGACDSPRSGSVALFLAQLRRHGLVFPYTCSACTFSEENFPAECSVCDAPNQTYAAAFKALQAQRLDDKARTPVLLITDIGADVDDTLALIALRGSDSLKLVGVATTVNNGKHRAALARQWLRVLGVPDDEVQVLPFSDSNSAACQQPPGFVAHDDRDALAALSIGEESDTPRALLELICTHGPRLVIVAIAPLTPLAASIKLDESDTPLGILRLVTRVYMQGQVLAAEGGHGSPVLPSDKGYNFRIDMAAAREVFEQLHFVKRPVSLLGKFAAYQISLTKQDLESLSGPGLPSLAIAARDQMQAFKQQNPSQFFFLFPIPEQYRLDTLHGGVDSSYEWFDHLPGDIVSHPYDALVVLMAEEDAVPFASPMFARVALSDCVESVGGYEPPAFHGVNNALAVKDAIMTLMRRAIQRAPADNSDP